MADFKDLLIDAGLDVPRKICYVRQRCVPPARYVFANSVAAAEGYSEQQKQGCELDN